MAVHLPLSRGSIRAAPRYYQVVIGTILVLFIAIAPPLISGIALGTVMVGALFLRKPMAALYLLVFSIPYESLHEIGVGGLNATATEYIAFMGGLAFLLQSAVKRDSGARWAWWSWPVIFFIVAAAISMTQASDLRYSIKELLKLAEMLLTYLLVLSYVDTPAKARRLLLLIALAATSEALIGVVQSFVHLGPNSFSRGLILRASGTFDQPNPYAGYLNFTLPLLLAGVALRVPIAGRFTRPMLVALTAAILLSVSRGALLASIGAALVIGLLSLRRTRPLIAVGFIALYGLVAGAVFGLVPSSVTGQVISALGLSNVDVLHPTPLTWSVAERLAHVLAGIRMFVAHPWLGVGIGNYQVVYPKYRLINTDLNPKDPAADLWVNSLGHAHNYYVNIAAEAGALGLFAFVVFLLSAIIIAVVLYRRAANPLARAVTLGTVGVLVTVLVQSFFDNIFVHAMEAQLALVMGLATVVCRMSVEEKAKEGEARYG